MKSPSRSARTSFSKIILGSLPPQSSLPSLDSSSYPTVKYCLSLSKICFDVIAIQGKAVTFLGNGTIDPMPYSQKTVNEIKCAIDRSKDVNAYLSLTMRFDEIIPESPQKKFIK